MSSNVFSLLKVMQFANIKSFSLDEVSLKLFYEVQ